MTIQRDSHDPAKRYDRVLFNDDRDLQDFEMNELQQIGDEKLERLGTAIFKEGGRVVGGDLAIVGNTANLQSGQVFARGQVRNVPAATISLTGAGSENIGVLVQYQTITAADDPSLVSPRTGDVIAERRKATSTWVLNNPAATTVYPLLDGQIITDSPPPSFSSVDVAMSRRTFDQSGDFLSKFGGVVIEALNADNVRVVVRPLAGYVQGHMLDKPSGVRLTVPIARTVRTVLDEPKTFHIGTTRYELNHAPTAIINAVTAAVQVERTITRGAVVNSADLLPDTPVASIVSVAQGLTPYALGVDCVLSGDSLNWALNGEEPSGGSTYTVTYQYIKQMIKGLRTHTEGTASVSRTAAPSDTFPVVDGTAVRLTVGETTFTAGVDYTAEFSPIACEITWPPGGSMPGFGVTYTASYDRWEHPVEGDYLGYDSFDRRDKAPFRNAIDFATAGDSPVDGALVYVDYDYALSRKDLLWLGGEGTLGREPGKPHPTNPQVPASPSGALAIGQLDCPADSADMTFTPYNVLGMTMTDLQAMRQALTDLRYNQSVQDLDRDARTKGVAYSLKGSVTDTFRSDAKSDTGNALYNCALDKNKGHLRLPYTSQVYRATVQSSSGDRTHRNLRTAAYTEESVLSQLKATDAMLINPFQVFSAPVPMLALSPNVDTWIQDSPGSSSLAVTWDWWGAPSGVSFSTDLTVGDMRQLTIVADGQSFLGLEDNIALWFNGSKIPLTPAGSTVAGTVPGTVKANASGAWRGSFTVPPGVRSGKVDVYAVGLAGNQSERAIYEASTTIRTLRAQTFTIRRDPLAQSFTLEQTRWVTSLDLWFTAKSATHPVRIEIRDMVNGYPGPTVQPNGFKVLQPADVSTSTATRITFDDPLLLFANTDYCMVVRSEGEEYAVRIATLGQIDPTVGTGGMVSKQPYTVGVLFKSSNNSTWEPIQTSDLKFNINAARFSAVPAIMTFDAMAAADMGQLLVLAQQEVPTGCSVKWEYSEDGGTTWLPTESHAETPMSTVRSSVKARLTMTASADGLLSPALDVVNSQFVGLLLAATGDYVNRLTQLAVEPSEARVYLDIDQPSGTAMTPYVSLDDGATWNAATLQSLTPLDSRFSQALYLFDFDDANVTGTQFRFRCGLSTGNRTTSPIGRNLMINLA